MATLVAVVTFFKGRAKMRFPQSEGAWEAIYQLAMAAVFFSFIAWGYSNAMSNTDLLLWLSLVGSSLGISFAKSVTTKEKT